ncbi:MAG: DMT family transporter [Moritella sp.]|uniref:DMT family transporter n=1 Tax=Moritella sp. TaxID=78556 RepID=UPI0025F4E8F0|nr:DMT family transporter [Moritella sp.]NQZ91803.1 DMT family transporter [Moritella sp.]
MFKILDKRIKTIGYTITALIAFAANSVLCRMALKDNAIDASSFTAIRLLSGVVMFLILLSFNSPVSNGSNGRQRKTWISALLLFIYAIALSFAYISLETGTGALVLFGTVQITMITMGVISGHRLRLFELLGMTVSFGGLAYLVYPTMTTPSFSGFMLMVVSGAAWGMYTVIGRGSTNPLQDNALNFKYTMPLVLVLVLTTLPMLSLSLEGVVYAVLSGAFASALGYTVWYIALRGLSATEAAVVQLSVPVIASIGGILFVSEPISTRLVIACTLVLGGILIVVLSNKRR